MITINIKKKDNAIISVNVKGHAGFNDYGKDIVCAAVSSLVMATINNATSLDKDHFDYLIEENKITLKPEDSILVQTLCQNLVKMLEDLKADYPRNITIRNEEER